MSFLKRKFKPQAIKRNLETTNKSKCANVKRKNKQSRQRYRVREYKKKLREYGSCPNKNVFNLSSIDLPISDLFALEYGHGFVLSPNNVLKEEETLVLEGFRFLDRLGKADFRLSKPADENISTVATDRSVNVVEDIDNAAANSAVGNSYVKSNNAPVELCNFLPLERELTLAESKNIKKEFEQVNLNALNSLKTPKRNKFYNVPKLVRDSIFRLKKLVKDKVIDIRKVDKGQTILIIDYQQRLLTEGENISKIAELCSTQSSNWKDNKDFTEEKMKALYCSGFVSKNELTAVTGLIAGGMSGKKKNKNGSIKFTQVISQRELFAEQKTPYVYPLYKAHKLTRSDLLNISSEEVHEKIPSRLVVGMQNCQLSRVQKWLENFLTPLSKLYGNFEYIKDSNDFLLKLETIKTVAHVECWDWSELILFTVDVKALYPSVQVDDVAKSLEHCFNKCTDWGG